MNCDELAATLTHSLIRERDPQWFHRAARHAEQCPTCLQLMELNQIEVHLLELPTVEASESLVNEVMGRISRLESTAAVESNVRLWNPIVLVGVGLLAIAYVIPAEGESWLSNLWSSVGVFRTVEVSAYFSHHPPWAIVFAAFASLLIAVGSAMPRRITQ